MDTVAIESRVEEQWLVNDETDRESGHVLDSLEVRSVVLIHVVGDVIQVV